MTPCTKCMYIDSTRENDTICNECVDGSKFEPHSGYKTVSPVGPTDEEIERVLKHIRDVCKSREKCRGCQFYNVTHGACGIQTPRPDLWTFVGEVNIEHKLFI